jgi:hypothetical protein
MAFKRGIIIFGMIVLSAFVIVCSAEMMNVSDVQTKPQYYNLNEGKNYFYFDRVVFAKDVVNLNPEIQSVSYFDEELNKSVGFVNVFKGIGRNFLIKPGVVYEITANKNMTLAL